LVGSQESCVQSLPSSQTIGVCRQAPVTGSHLSTVHGFWSSQLTAACTHRPVAGSQESDVHGLASSQLVGVPTQIGPTGPWTQRAPWVQRLPSSHGSPTSGSCRQSPVAGSQESLVHELPSSQFSGVP